MEDLWRVKDSGVDIEDFADYAEYRRFLQRFKDEEEEANRRHLLFGESVEKESARKRRKKDESYSRE